MSVCLFFIAHRRLKKKPSYDTRIHEHQKYHCNTHWTAHKLFLCHILLVFTKKEAVSKFKNPDHQLATHSIFHSTIMRPASFSSNSLHSSLFDSSVTRLNTLPQTGSKVTVPPCWTHAYRFYQFSRHTAQPHEQCHFTDSTTTPRKPSLLPHCPLTQPTGQNVSSTLWQQAALAVLSPSSIS
jgi:hypothetical protein